MLRSPSIHSRSGIVNNRTRVRSRLILIATLLVLSVSPGEAQASRGVTAAQAMSDSLQDTQFMLRHHFPTIAWIVGISLGILVLMGLVEGFLPPEPGQPSPRTRRRLNDHPERELRIFTISEENYHRGASKKNAIGNP